MLREENLFSSGLAKINSINPLAIKLNDPMTTFYQNLITILPDLTCRTLIFTSAQRNEGAGIIIREFAKLCAFKFFKKVLIIDMNTGVNSQINYFNKSITSGWVEAARMGIPVWKTICQVKNSNLYLSSLSNTTDAMTAFEPETQGIKAYIEEITHNFDYILIDTSSELVHSEALLLTKKIDGIVLVVEANKSRWQSVKKIKNRLLAKNGNIVGILFNNRKYAIPNFIYKML